MATCEIENIIPVVHMFNNNYVIAAAVAFYSMLKNADKNFFYSLYVLHYDITVENQDRLKKQVENFENAELNFINVKDNFKDLFEKTKNQSHFSCEIYLKYLVPVLLEQYDKAIVSDVDVIYLGDISKSFVDFKTDENNYLAACKTIGKKQTTKSIYYKFFTEAERSKLKFAGGYYIQNLKKMREDDIPNKLIEFTKNNYQRLIQPEQDVINIVCADKIKTLPVNSLVCTYAYEMFKEDYNGDSNFSSKEVQFALKNPIQLHYAGKEKPWKVFDVPMSKQFFYYLSQTDFFYDVVANTIKKPDYYKKIFRIHSRKFDKELVLHLQSRK